MQPQGDTAMIGEPQKKATFGKSYQSIDPKLRLYETYLDYIISGSDSYNDYKTNIMNDETFLIYSIHNGLIKNIIDKEKDRTLSRLLKENYNIIIYYLNNNNEPIEEKIKLIKLIIDWRFETRDLKNFEQNINLKEINTKIQNNELTEDEEKSYQKFYNMALNDEQKRKEICEILKLHPDNIIKGDYDFAGGKSRTNKKKQKKTKKNKEASLSLAA
jgi:hypothetical protein